VRVPAALGLGGEAGGEQRRLEVTVACMHESYTASRDGVHNAISEAMEEHRLSECVYVTALAGQATVLPRVDGGRVGCDER
jgi:hypothetical protein